MINIELNKETKKHVSIVLNSVKIIKNLALLAIFLILLSLILTYLDYQYSNEIIHKYALKFNMDKEYNIPTFFSAGILFFAACLFKIIALIRKSTKDSYILHWTILSMIFFLLSIDELIQYHERLIKPLSRIFNLEGMFYFSWVIAGITVVLAFIAFFIRFFFALPMPYRFDFFIAAICYVCGVLGFELIGGYYISTFKHFDFTYNIITVVEETLEMAGIILLINTQFKYLRENNNIHFILN